MCMWSCAKATTTQDFNAAMERLKRINAGAWEYLDKISPKQWSRAHFSEYLKLDNYTNNNCEVFNAKVKKMKGKPIITMLEEVRCYVMRIMARNKKALVGYSGRLAPTQQSRLEREKRESNKWRPLPTGDDAGNVYEVHCLPIKVSVDLGKGTCSCRLWQITGLPCRHACAALAYQNRRPEEYAHNWLTMGAYNAAYQTSMRPVPSQEYWEHLETLPILPPLYRKPIGRPTLKRDKRNDGPKEKSDPHRTTRRIGTIICKYCLQAGHNKRSCKKRKEAMGEGSSAPQALADEEDEDMLAEMYYEETLEDAEAEQEATEERNKTTPAHTPQQPHPMPRPPTAPPQPPTNNVTTRKQVRRRSVKRPPPTGQRQQPTTPPANQPATTPSTHNSQTAPHPMQGASVGTSTRFMQFMPTPGVVTPTARGRGTSDTGRGQGRGRSRIRGSSGGKNGLSSGSSNSTPIS
ncbi:uncharacterized protein LOC107630251 isoform X1 [Arachis ipaensis]|uniref:uncharacterized protein LOC107630251 isoform X1 n=1 Tax=Arachis ipaensis TaxID=130454 RepID=UPI0007AFB175|nr:uncharacterized protein LOC107630251 isoform X1 [Arachis ipaensis]XP_025643927.1 uncharacterized protein LOC112737958 isoform X1 [Arachis hypogaea]XP_029147371.1 uncharacterized protein LOC112737958 isoform X1 [Arachis hypogaea]